MSKMGFRIAPHGSKPDTRVVEILVDGMVCGVIYPKEDKTIELISAHIKEYAFSDGSNHYPPIPSLSICFDPMPYTIIGSKIVKQREQ